MKNVYIETRCFISLLFILRALLLVLSLVEEGGTRQVRNCDSGKVYLRGGRASQGSLENPWIFRFGNSIGKKVSGEKGRNGHSIRGLHDLQLCLAVICWLTLCRSIAHFGFLLYSLFPLPSSFFHLTPRLFLFYSFRYVLGLWRLRERSAASANILAPSSVFPPSLLLTPCFIFHGYSSNFPILLHRQIYPTRIGTLASFFLLLGHQYFGN
jgi:hypothetical protein